MNPTAPGCFQRMLRRFRRKYQPIPIRYDSVKANWKKQAKEFEEGLYGVYILRAGEKVLYIGKAGTIIRTGPGGSGYAFKKQDLRGRLSNERSKGKSAKEWMIDICAGEGGVAIDVDYFVLPKSGPSPAYCEALLLEAYLRQYGTLPPSNDCF